MALFARRLVLIVCGMITAIIMIDQFRNISVQKTSQFMAKYQSQRLYETGAKDSDNIQRLTTKQSSSTVLPVTKSAKKTSYPLTLMSPYLINNPSICKSKEKLNYVVIVHTSTDHFKRRSIIRHTWGNINILRNRGFRIVFFFGLSKNEKTQTMLENESTVYGDIVQGHFVDSYHNLTHKGVLTYRWLSEFCSNVEMVVKVDDDMFVNIFYLMEYYLPKYRKSKRSLMCHNRPKGTSPIMRQKSKWQVKDEQFKNMTHYPVTYCNGYFVLISADIIRELYKSSFLTPFFWVDDVYLYGLLPDKIGNVKFTQIAHYLTLQQETGMKCYTGNTTCKYVASYAQKKGYMELMWYASLKMYAKIAQKFIAKELLIS
ncbi:beta-1,3-galactosyltransferase 1-like isoform X2 [Saccostrea echinata]|uniref:beta-1,3-galactosyltransferase 1-like isoform X2 n=1 Tax=Saccostrea echinata TaxID=191078 RepID=UPI002A7FE4FD|nr:beta-1,3-galactosyltransferase 1-like isoform X2 [Saccostrea echinata]